MLFDLTRPEIGALGAAAALLLIALRVPVGVVLGGVSFVGIAVLTSTKAAWGLLATTPYTFVANWSLSAVPMFLLMGFVASEVGLTRGLFASMRQLIGWVPGGLASATVVASALFASASGSSVATAAAFSRLAVPEMLKAGYQPGLATGSVAASGTLGSLIPPSILMILFGIFTETSIGGLFVAGIIPGILSALVYIGMITLRVWFKPSLAPISNEVFTREEKLAALRDVWPLPVLILGIMGGIFSGIFTPTEAGGIGAALALMIGFFRKSLTWRAFRRGLVDTAFGTCTVFIIAIGAAMFSKFMGLSKLPDAISGAMLPYVDNVYLMVLCVGILFIILGMFVESISLMLLTLPILQPFLSALDVNMIWFGIIVVKLLEIGLITPPVGLNVYVMRSALGNRVRLGEIFAGATWFIAMDVLTLVILVLFPALSLFLPMLMS